VDDGAVPHIVNGADVMRPGIKEINGDFGDGDVVLIRDLKGRYIAIGVSLVSASEMRSITKGKVVKVIHHLGDRLWHLSQELLKSK
jgi:PUA domain protein